MRRRDVAAAAWTNGEPGARSPGRSKHEPVADDGRRDDFERHAAHRPELAPGVRIVCHDTTLAADDELVADAGGNHDRRSPPDGFGARRLPQRPARARVERGHEGSLIGTAFMILVEEDAVLVENRRARRTVIVVDR